MAHPHDLLVGEASEERRVGDAMQLGGTILALRVFDGAARVLGDFLVAEAEAEHREPEIEDAAAPTGILVVGRQRRAARESDSFSTPALATVKVFRHSLFPTLEIEYRLNVPAQLTLDRKTRSKALVKLPITSRISLAPGIPRIDIHTEVNNTAKDHRLRVHFPAPFVVDKADHDGHFEVVRRPIGVPESTEKWVEQPRPETHQGAVTDISNGKVGLTLANRGLPEVEALNNGAHTEIALTLLRSVGWLSRNDISARQSGGFMK